MPLLDTPEAVLEMLDSFDDMDSDAIRAFFEANGIRPGGVIQYATLMCGGALSMANPASDAEALVVMQALFSAGVVLGIKLADKRDEASRSDTLHVLRPPAAQ